MSLPFETYVACGLSVLPVRLDKRPVIFSWGEYQKRAATGQEMALWTKAEGIAVVGGEVSGGLTCIDVDMKYDPFKTVYAEFCEILTEWGHGSLLEKLVVETTPSGGYHILFKSSLKVGCEKLARAHGKTEAMLETKGEGGYFLCAPTPGYIMIQGAIEEIPTIGASEAEAILSACWALDRTDAPPAEPVRIEKVDGKSPFEDYNDRADSYELLSMLTTHGWREVGKRGENVNLCRPEKSGKATSATFHHGKRVFYVFTSSSNFHPGKGYGPVSIYAALEHGGDLKAAARALLSMGYGESRKASPTAPKIETGVKSSTASTLAEEILALYHKPFYPGESTGWPEMDKIFKIEKGQMNILFGIPSHGKSSWMDAVLANVVFACNWKALIFSPENKSAAYHASKLCEILIGKPMYGEGRMAPAEVLEAGNRVAERFTFLSQADGGTTLDEILEKVREAKPDIVVVDPWNRINHTRDGGLTETEYIGASLAKTSALAKNLNISFWYVVHPQKLRRDKNGDIIRPGFYEVSGSAHWANMADNGILVYRNFIEEVTEIETVKVRYRHNGSVGVVKLKFDRPSGRFRGITDSENFMGQTGHQIPTRKDLE